jgi:hypothetical protein
MFAWRGHAIDDQSSLTAWPGSGRTQYTTLVTEARIVIEPDPVIEVFKKDIDRTLLRANLKLSPEERLRKMQSAVSGLRLLREAYAKSRP